MRKQSVIFDMDGTLFDTETIFQEEWNRLARERGLALPPDFKYAICGTSGEAMNRIIERYYHVPEGGEIQRLCKERVARRLAEHVPEKEGARELISFSMKRDGPWPLEAAVLPPRSGRIFPSPAFFPFLLP